MKTVVVLKYGGTSVSTFANWKHIIQRIGELHTKYRVIVVISALQGVTNKLQKIVSVDTPMLMKQQLIKEILILHKDLAIEAGMDSLPCLVNMYHLDLVNLVNTLIDGHLQPNIEAEILSFGELMSVALGVEILKNVKLFDCGLVDSRNIIKTEYNTHRTTRENYTDAIIDVDKILNFGSIGIYNSANVVLTQGFIGSVRVDGEFKTCLLGRGGSDTSGSLYSYITNAERYEIYSDVNGVYDSDPNVNKKATLLTHISYDVAETMANNGAKVIHCRCILPLKQKSIPCIIRNVDLDESEFTLIDKNNS
jgi:diaminopimelate decarboxylase/aspartate kinase